MIIGKFPIGKYTYACIFPYHPTIVEFCRKLNKETARRIVFSQKAWRFNDLDIAFRLSQQFPLATIQPDVWVEMLEYKLNKEAEAKRMTKALMLKSAKDTAFRVAGLKKELYPYQNITVEFLLNANNRGLVASEMGSGKTASALATVVYNQFAKTIVVCPASAKFVWEDEVNKWTHLRPYVIDTGKRLTELDWANHDIFIINYDILEKFYDVLDRREKDCLIIDEVHRIKTPGTVRKKKKLNGTVIYVEEISCRRTHYCQLLSKGCKSVIALSGTPLLNRPVEMFNILNIIDPAKWSSYWGYCQRYCGMKKNYWGGVDVKGKSNIGELRGRIAPIFIRHEKDDVLPFLPPKVFIDVPVKLDPDRQLEYDDAEKAMDEYVNTKVSERDEFTSVLSLLTNLRMITSLGKVEAACDFIQDLIENSGKTIVFSVYNEPLRQIKDFFGDQAVYLTGETSMEQREASVKSFQNDPNVKVFLGGTKSAGEAITLTEARNTVFLDYSWVPADHDQASNRNHRPGVKHDSLNVYQFYTKGTVDDHTRSVLEEKKETFKQLFGKLDGDKSQQAEMINAIVGKYKEKFNQRYNPKGYEKN